MKHIFASLWLVFSLVCASATAQTAPVVPPAPPAGLQGPALRTWLLQNWYDGKRTELSYNTARGKMYNYADNYNNQVECVYSGYTTPVPFSTTNTGTGGVGRINCEHTVPQSWFNEVVRMRSDIHHLFPTYDTWNNNRGSDPFAEIPDASTTLWMRGTTSQTTIPTANLDEWSEDTNSQFEPREDHKGNTARAIFYFYTMHGGQAALAATGHADINSVASITTLYQWHLADPVDAHEIERNRRTAISQGNYNPYINFPNLVAEAWGLNASGPNVSFAASTGTIAEGNSGTSTYTITLTANPAPTAPISVNLVLSSVNSTASNGSDFVFTSPTTVSFAAGQTSATTTVTVNGDTRPEADETMTLNITSPSAGANVGTPSTHTLTITNDDGAVPTVSFATATAAGSIAEGNSGTSTYTVTVDLANAGSSGSFTVPVAVDASSTASSADYVLNTTSVSFGSGTPATISITVNGDATFEPNETVVLSLGAPSNSGVLLGTPTTHTLTITNDDMAPASSPCTKLFFTQYTEGSANNTKALEIFNPSNAPVNLTGKRVELFANGASATPTSTQALTGTLAPGAVYVIANTGVVDMGIAAIANVQSSVAFYNGNDALVLFDGTDTLDIIGVVGQSPTSWTTAGGGSTLNHTIVRLPGTSQGGRWNGPFGSATWSGTGVDNFTGFGSYTSTACVVTGARPTLVRHGLELYPNPASETVRVRLPGTAAALNATIEVLDQLGRAVRQRAAVLSATDAAVVDLHGLTPGLYAVRVSTGTVQYTGRVLVK